MRRIVCLLTVIFGMVSCSEESLPEIKEGQSSDEVIHQQLTFKELSLKMSENPMVFTYEFKSVVIENYELSVSYVLKNLSETESTTEPVIDYFFDPVHNNETYSFITHPYVGQGDYLEKFVITIEDGEQKVGYLRYYPITDFTTENFTGKIEISNLDRSQIDETYLENGIVINNQTSGIQDDCTTTFVITYHTCSHGGGHWIGQECKPPHVNDAHISVNKYTTCTRTITSNVLEMPAFIMDINPNRGGGGGGNSNNSQAQQNHFLNALPYDLQEWLDENPNIKGFILSYLSSNQYSNESKAVANQLIAFIENDEVLSTPDNLLTEFVVNQALYSTKFDAADFIDFWDNLTAAEKMILQNYADNGISANGYFLKPSVVNLLNWAFPYLIENKGITIEYFENWFVEGGDMSYSLMSEFLSDLESPDLIIPTRRFKNNTRLNAIYNKIKQAANIKQYLENFDSQFSVAHLILDTKPFTNNNDVNALTYEPEHYRIEIVFNENNLNRPWLDIARTMMHEVIHAEMYRILLSLASTNGQIDKVDLENKLTSHNYPGLYEYYRIYGFQNMQHPQMADHYRGIIRTFLMQLDSTVTYAQADAMAWVGLQGTTAWNNLTTAQKNNIINTYNSWYNNAPINLP